jgi:amino acid transporter
MHARRPDTRPRRPPVRAPSLLGKPIATADASEQAVGVATGVSILGLDALSSAAYGPEAALTVLLPAGVAGIHALLPITAAVLVLLVAVCSSYWQTIGVSPDGASSYTVAKANLGTGVALLAASALSIDYLLNVAVGISAGVGALVSAVPALLPHRLLLCLGLLALLTLVNLRGLRASGRVFTAPTYLFVAALLVTIAAGAIRALAGGGAAAAHAAGAVSHPAAAGTGALGAWLIVRAFAGGCTALTGVEAVSNAVPVFRQPAVVHARRTLALIMVILVVLLAGIALLCRALDIGATPPEGPQYESVLSQLVRAVMGRGWFYFASMAAVVSVLCLSANTSFAAFPQLGHQLAADRFLPAAFAHRGPRLVYVPGILLLAGAAAVLLIAFGGATDRLIPLFAIGAFLAFTLSQLGMVFHWRRTRGRHSRHALVINAAGAALTAVTVVVVVVSKFTEGAWVTVLLVPAMLALFRGIRRASDRVEREIGGRAPLELRAVAPPVVLLPLARLDRAARRGLAFALRISPDVQALQLLTEWRDEEQDLSARWSDLVVAPAAAAGHGAPSLTVIRAKYRDLVGPLVEHVRRLAVTHPGRDIAVLMPEHVRRRWYQVLLGSRRSTRVRRALLATGVRGIVVIDTPWYLD